MVGTDIVNKGGGDIIAVIAVEPETPGSYHATVNAIASLLGRSRRRATDRCPVVTPFVDTERPPLEAVSGI